MATDKKISELPVAAGINANDISVLVNNGVDYQFSISLLLQFLTSNLSTGVVINFGTVIPQNNTGKNGDLFVKTDSGQLIQKVSGSWTVVYTLPAANGADGAVLYGSSNPASATGKDLDTYINTVSGVFYLKTSGSWNQVFSMQTGPQGPKGNIGETGPAGIDGKTILSDVTIPSNLIGNDGDYYMNTAVWRLYGPKTAGVWGAGVALFTENSFAVILGNPEDNIALAASLDNKVDKIAGKQLSDENYTSLEKTKLANLSEHYVGYFATLASLQASFPTGLPGQYATVDAGVGVDADQYVWDNTDTNWVLVTGPGNVLSVNGQVGPVSLSTDNIGEGSTNKYFTDARVAIYGDTRYAQKSTTLTGYGITDAIWDASRHGNVPQTAKISVTGIIDAMGAITGSELIGQKVSVGGANSGPQLLYVSGNLPGSGLTKYYNTNNAGYSSNDFFDDANTMQLAFGYANTGVANTFLAGLSYFLSPNKPLAFIMSGNIETMRLTGTGVSMSVPNTITRNDIRITSTDGLVLNNSTLSTSTVTQQFSPRINFVSSAWSTGTAANVTNKWFMEARAFSSSGVSSNLYLMYNTNGGSNTDMLLFEATGRIKTLAGYANIISSANGIFDLQTTGGLFTRNVNDAFAAFTINQQQGTGNILNLQFGSASRFTVDPFGNGSFFGRVSIGQTSGGAAQLFLVNGITTSAAFSILGFGIQQAAATYTSTAAGGTQANAYVNSYAAATLAASNATTLTKVYGNFFNPPIAGTNVTFSSPALAIGTGGDVEINGSVFASNRAAFGKITVAGSVVDIDPSGYSTGNAFSSLGFGLKVSSGNTYTSTAVAGTQALGTMASFGTSTFAATNATTITNASTLYVGGSPVAGANVTLTNAWSLYVATGSSFFGSGVYVPSINASSNPNNSSIALNSTGTVISRNVADSSTALIVNQANASSTGNVLNLQFAGSNVTTINQVGAIATLGRLVLGTIASPNAIVQLSIATYSNGNPYSTTGFGIRQDAITYTSTAVGATIAATYVNSFATATLAASNATTLTKAYGSYFNAPVGGANTTIGSAYAIGTNGDAEISGNIWVASRSKFGSITTVAGAVVDIDPTSFSTTQPFGASGFGFRVNSNTYTSTALSGSPSLAVVNSFASNALAATNAQTITNAATVYIAGAPTASTNTTIGVSYALWINSGNTYFGGSIYNGTPSYASGGFTSLVRNSSGRFETIANTGTGNNVLSDSPTFTGTLTGATATFSGSITSNGPILSGGVQSSGGGAAFNLLDRTNSSQTWTTWADSGTFKFASGSSGSTYTVDYTTQVLTFMHSPIVPTATTSGQAVNLGQLNTAYVPYSGANHYLDLGHQDFYAGSAEIGHTAANGSGLLAGIFYNGAETGEGLWIHAGSATKNAFAISTYNAGSGYSFTIKGTGDIYTEGTISGVNAYFSGEVGGTHISSSYGGALTPGDASFGNVRVSAFTNDRRLGVIALRNGTEGWFMGTDATDANWNLTIDGATPFSINRTTKAALLAGDVEISDTTKGVILKSPNGARWRITIDNSGTLIRTSI
jgi:hypothetical protein